MKLFVTSRACASRRLCKSCLDPGPLGDKWREGMEPAYDFTGARPCPHGVTCEQLAGIPTNYDGDYRKDSKGTEGCSCA